jgi:hypothetical protein
MPVHWALPVTEAHETFRRDALTTFLESRVDEGFTIESRTPTQAILVPARNWSLLARFRKGEAPGRQVVSVDVSGTVTMSPAEPLRS